MSDTTEHLLLPKPNPDHEPPLFVAEEFLRLREAMDIIDQFLFDLSLLVSKKAADDHTHAIAGISGLVEALNEKMPANRQFKLDDLTDVEGATEAAINYVMVKAANGKFVPSTALAALGVHPHLISEITGLAAELASRPPRSEVAAALDLLVPKDGTLLTGGFRASSVELAGLDATVSPEPGNILYVSNTAARTIRAPTLPGVYTVIVEIVNGAGAGAVTLSGFSFVDGDTITTTQGHAFQIFITKTARKVVATVKALQ